MEFLSARSPRAFRQPRRIRNRGWRFLPWNLQIPNLQVLENLPE
jgi:hypothetical protein